MSRIFKTSGFPSEISEKIEMATVPELMYMPIYQYVSVEDAYKYGGEFYRKLLDAAPIKNDRKNAILTAKLQYLNPNSLSIKFLENWHGDGERNPFESKDRIHLLISDCTAITEFNTNEFEIEMEENETQADLNDRLKNYDFPFEAKSIEPNKFITFDISHIHRAVAAKKPEFRFMFRIIESNSLNPSPYEKANLRMSHVYKEINGKLLEVPNIEKFENGVFVHK